MVIGNQSWQLSGWRRSSSPIPMVSANTFSQIMEYSSETETAPTLASDERLNEAGYITNAPLELGDEDYVHRMVIKTSANGEKNAWWEYDPSWTSQCRIISRQGYTMATSGTGYYRDFRKSMRRELDFTGYRYGEGCDTEGNHYWLDETQGPFTQGCGDAEADNYSADADYTDDSLCTYSCNDPNRLLTSKGSCGECVDGYGLNDDGLCEAGLSTKLSENAGLIGGGLAVLAIGGFFIKRRLSK